MNADNQLRLEAEHLLVQKTRFRLRQGFWPGPAARIACGALFPINFGVTGPVGRGEISVQVNPTGIDPGGRAGKHAIWVEHRHKAPMDRQRRVRRRLAGQTNPVQGHRASRQLIAMNGAHHQHPQPRFGRQNVTRPKRLPFNRASRAGLELRCLTQFTPQIGQGCCKGDAGRQGGGLGGQPRQGRHHMGQRQRYEQRQGHGRSRLERLGPCHPVRHCQQQGQTAQAKKNHVPL